MIHKLKYNMTVGLLIYENFQILVVVKKEMLHRFILFYDECTVGSRNIKSFFYSHNPPC